jgi:hypothetical protein
MPEPDVKVPGIGKIDKKYAIGGGLAAIAIVVIVVVRKKAQSSAANATTTAGTPAGAGNMVTDPAGNQCSVLDPNSGYCPGTAEDLQYQQDQTLASSSLAGGGDSPYGGGNEYSGYDAAGYPLGSQADLAWQQEQQTGTTTTTGTSASGITTNSEWITDALSELPGDSTTNQTALISVFGGITVTTAQKDIYNEAVGVLGPPPVAPPPIKTSDTSSQPGSGGVTNAAVSGLHVASTTTSSVSLAWNRTPRATSYNIQTQGGPTITVAGTSATITGLKAGTHYTFNVAAKPSTSGHSSVSATTQSAKRK